MNFNFSSTVERFHPRLRDDLKEISEAARWLDSDIKHRGVLVCARMAPTGRDPDSFSGMAWPNESSIVMYGPRPGLWQHPRGRIDLRLAHCMSWEDKVRLFAHELRHLGQFHQGWRNGGDSICLPYSPKTAEADAYAFENLVLETLR